MKTYFIHCRIVDPDGGPARYSDKPLKSTRKRTVRNLYFETESDNWEIKANLVRGKTFFTVKDGFLYGATVALRKFGKFVEK